MNQNAFHTFVEEIKQDKAQVEGIAVADGETILAEHHFVPDLPRNIYSHTKSFVVSAVGMAIEDGVISLQDSLASVFPDKVTAENEAKMKAVTLQNLLKMSSGFGKALLMGAQRREGAGCPDYLDYMLAQPLTETPGEKFVYSSADSHLAAMMVSKKIGVHLSVYLYERLLKPLGQGFPLWECTPDGTPFGGGGMHLRLTEMMKLGQLYLNDGCWKGDRILSSEWIHTVSRKQIETPADPQNPWSCGYGYQFWISPFPQSYRADGAYGQVTTVLPEKNLVVAVQCPEVGDFNLVRPLLDQMIREL